MNIQTHEELRAKIWEIANQLRGPYRPPQYRLVMLPMVVLQQSGGHTIRLKHVFVDMTAAA